MNKINNCIICGHTGYKIIEIKNKNIKYLKCERCGLYCIEPLPSVEISDQFYKNDYSKFLIENGINFFNLMRKCLEDIHFDKFISGKNNLNFLDIGSSTGHLLDYIKNKGLKVIGIEPSIDAAKYSVNNFGLDIKINKIEEVEFKKGSFDIIHMSHVIEHLFNPVCVIEKINSWLKENGILLISTPDSGGLFTKIYSTKWRLFQNDHLHLFNRQCLIRLLKRNGFKIEKVISWGSIPAGWTSSIIKKIADRIVKIFNKGDVVFIMAVKKI